MPNKTVIVSLSDEKYFELLLELIDSINNFHQSKEVDICILDAGMNDGQINTLRKISALKNLMKKNGKELQLKVLKIF